ncbi:hypothetical protein [Oceanobacillus sp. CAU 1775]
MKKYYMTGHTAQGQVQLHESNIQGLKIINLPYESLTFNTLLLERFIEEYKEETSIEVLKSSLSNKFLEGIILRDKGVALISKEQPKILEAYHAFAKGLKVHDDLEAIYIKEMHFHLADQRAENLIHELLKDTPKKKRDAYTFRRFFGTNTMEGVVNEVPNLIAPLTTVYHIKGRAGTGKSTFMKKIAKACLVHGLDVELYHCSFDFNSIDMVLVPELKVCLFDSTDPHEFHPVDLEREKVIDLYEIAVTPGTDEKYAQKIDELTKSYKSFMKKGIEEIKNYGAAIVSKEEKLNFSDEEIEQAFQKLLKQII